MLPYANSIFCNKRNGAYSARVESLSYETKATVMVSQVQNSHFKRFAANVLCNGILLNHLFWLLTSDIKQIGSKNHVKTKIK